MNILITGGSRGIGAAIVAAFRDAGHKVGVVGLHKTECDYFHYADLTRIDERAFVVDRVADALGGIDILVNNAGIQGHCSFLDVLCSDWQNQIELMLTVPFDLSQQAAKHMLRNGGGHIINILSTSAFQGARNISPYVAAKHGLLGLTRAMAIELAPLIHVNGIAPGLTDTDMTRKYIDCERREFLNTLIPAGRFGRPEEIADAVLWLTQQNYIYGQVITVDGGWCVKNVG